jgi:hypothetical protein
MSRTRPPLARHPGQRWCRRDASGCHELRQETRERCAVMTRNGAITSRGILGSVRSAANPGNCPSARHSELPSVVAKPPMPPGIGVLPGNVGSKVDFGVVSIGDKQRKPYPRSSFPLTRQNDSFDLMGSSRKCRFWKASWPAGRPARRAPPRARHPANIQPKGASGVAEHEGSASYHRALARRLGRFDRLRRHSQGQPIPRLWSWQWRGADRAADNALRSQRPLKSPGARGGAAPSAAPFAHRRHGRDQGLQQLQPVDLA